MRIIVVKNRALGDAVMGLSSLQYLRSLYPNAEILYLVPSWTFPLFDKSKFDFKIAGIELKSIKGYLKLIRTIKEFGPDHLHELHQSGRTRRVFSILSKIFGFSYTAHNHHPTAKNSQVVDQGVIKELIQRDLDGVYSYLGKGDLPAFTDFSPRLNYSVSKNERIIFGVVATRPSKMWPLKYFVSLANMLIDKEIAIPLSPSETDQQIKQSLIELGLSSNVKFIELPLNELGPFIAESSAYIGNDTGLKHIAVAAGLKTLTFFGPEPAKEWHPYETKNHQYVILDMECRTQGLHYCGLFECDHHSCMNKLSPKLAFDSYFRLISNS